MSKKAQKLGIGIIGAGGIAQGIHIPGYNKLAEKCEVLAIAEPNADVAKQAAEKFNIKQVFSDYKDMLKLKEIDAISVCTPNFLHMQPTIDALKAGKHVLCEKPLAKNGDEARKMVKVANESGKILQVALQWRFSGAATAIKKVIDRGELGDLYYARAQALRRRGIPGWGVFIDKEKQGGGPLIDIGVHILDFTLYLMGYPKPVTVSASCYQKFGKRSDVVGWMGQWDASKFTVEDFAVGLIKFENGATVVLESSFAANIKDDLYQTEILGDKGGVSVAPGDSNSISIATENNMQVWDMKPRGIKDPQAHHAEIEAFVNAIQNNLPSPVPGEQGLILNAIFDAMYKSSETGKEQAVNLKL